MPSCGLLPARLSTLFSGDSSSGQSLSGGHEQRSSPSCGIHGAAPGLPLDSPIMSDQDSKQRVNLSTTHSVRKAVIPAAGLGTRFLPATKAQPKEMLPLIDTPTIQYVVEELAKSGIPDVLIVTGKGKTTIEDHFDRSWQLEEALTEGGKTDDLNLVRGIAALANIHYIRQKKTAGLGDAIRCARSFVGDEPFAVLLGDTIVDGEVPITRQLAQFYDTWRCPVIGVERVPKEKVGRYGIIAGKQIDNGTYIVNDLVEKPKPDEAPSDLAIGGRYVLTPDIFDYIDQTSPGKNGEIQITDALKLLCKQGRLYAYRFEGKRHDIGNRLDYLKTTVEFALKRDEVKKEFRDFLLEVLGVEDPQEK